MTGTPRTSRARPRREWEHWNGPGWRDAVDWVERRARQPAVGLSGGARRRGDIEVATDIAAHAALMGFSVQLFETLAWAEELLDAATAADVRRLPRLYTAAGYACFAGRAEAARTQRAPGDRAGGRRPLRRVRTRVRDRSSRRSARSTAATSTATSSSPARWRARYGADRGYGLASYVDGLQSSGRVEEALALTEESVAAARDARQPVLDRRTRSGSPAWRSRKADARRALAAWDEGVAFVREHRVQFFEGFLARDAARLHTSDGEPEAALVLFAEAIAAFQRAGNVPQLIITLASVPALFERLDRLEPAATLLGALSREPSSFHHVPELADLGAPSRRARSARSGLRELIGGRRGARPRRRRRLRPPADRRRPPRPGPAARASRAPAA